MDLVAGSGFDTPCILISSPADTEVGARAIEAGALDFLVRPFDGHELGHLLGAARQGAGHRWRVAAAGRVGRSPPRRRQDRRPRPRAAQDGPPVPEERVIVNQHPEVGYRMVRKVGFLNEAADMVLAHQERLDGSGYPHGLKGEAIPLSARIFGVADTVDAITSDRPYRAAQSFAVARTELLKEAGRTLDPKVVEAYAKVPDLRV